MKSLTLTVAPGHLEEALDRVLPLAPHGVHELGSEDRVELLLFGTDEELPDGGEVLRLCGDLIRNADLADAPESWQGRRLATHRPVVVGNRISIRPEWAPAQNAAPIELILSDEGLFGDGSHPTTHACLEFLVGLEPHGGLADLGCGLGVVAIAAALLGWSPVTAVDIDPLSLEATRANAARNSVELDVRRHDLLTAAPPAAETMVTNSPLLAVHQGIAANLAEPPSRLIASGVPADEAEALIVCYFESAGLVVEEQRVDGGWASVMFTRLA